MKHIVTVFLWCLALTSAAQNCTVTDCGFIPNINAGWKSIDVRPDGGLVGALEQGVDLGDVLAVRLDPQGQVIWTKRLATTSPLIHLDVEKVVSTSDGGMLVFGFGRVHADATLSKFYTNYFNIKLTANGEVTWARYYMMSNAISLDWIETSTIDVVPTGGYLMLLSRSNGMCAVRLDDSGLPLWHKRYSGVMYNGIYQQAASALHVEADGSFCFGGTMYYDPFVVRTDPMGTVIWARTYSYTVSYPLSISKKAGGGYLLAGNNGFGWPGEDGFSMSLAAERPEIIANRSHSAFSGSAKK